MKKLVVVGWVVALLGIGGVAVPGLCQNFGFRIQQPDFTDINGGLCSVKWTDVPAPGAPPANITWYYSTSPTGADRRRMSSLYWDDFSRPPLTRNWRPSGPFITDWAVHQDGREKRQILSGNRDAGPCTSKVPIAGNVVLSVLVKPQGIRNAFQLGLRTQEGRNNDGFFLRTDGVAQTMTVERVDRGISTPLGAAPLKDAATAGKWYWYEFSLRTRKKSEVAVCVRVFDEKHQRVMASFGPVTDKFSGQSPLLQGGGVSLGAPADYAEVYVDPWEARWTGRENGEFKWNIDGVPAGEYYLVAEIADDRRLSQPIISPFKLDIRPPGAGQMQALKSDDH